MSAKAIREWTSGTSPDASTYTMFQRSRGTDERPVVWVTDHVAVDHGGVDVFTNVEATGEAVVAAPVPTDVVLAAIFRQAGIVDDLQALLDAAKREGGGANYAAAKRIEAAFGEALS
jgi:hypothetical protein